MPVVLLLLGIVTVVAGLLLAAPVLTVRDGSFDIAAITPGVVAIVGGFVLIGLGLAVRALQRIERAIAERPAPVAAGTAEAPGATEAPDAAVRIPFPPKLESSTQSASAAAQASKATEDATLERMSVKFPNLTRIENTPATEGAEVSSTLRPVVQAEEEIGELKNSAVFVRRGNGASPARVAPRFDLKPRAGIVPDIRAKSPVFKSVAAARRAAEQAASQAAVPPATAEPPLVDETAIEAAPAAEKTPAASVLKSGVVEGMAYTLYSDGSIEAQLPQGTLRFGSIAALREHIESGS